MRRVRQQCGAQRSTEAKRSPQHADPSAARDTPKNKPDLPNIYLNNNGYSPHTDIKIS
ncbi:MAG: hypothetical protein NZ455_13710 [Bacteroidia bacterium]|nr:hypothetical protein [Bacteroidia bacterium]MDW8345587.1 hypothetical protein [Bacteroidia bacterium]